MWCTGRIEYTQVDEERFRAREGEKKRAETSLGHVFLVKLQINLADNLLASSGAWSAWAESEGCVIGTVIGAGGGRSGRGSRWLPLLEVGRNRFEALEKEKGDQGAGRRSSSSEQDPRRAKNITSYHQRLEFTSLGCAAAAHCDYAAVRNALHVSG